MRGNVKKIDRIVLAVEKIGLSIYLYVLSFLKYRF